MIVPGSVKRRSAATTHSPSVPAPSTATSPPPGTWARKAAWMAQAAGSTITAPSSDSASGTRWIWLAWATSDVDQPPPVSAQYPVCRPGLRCPMARCWQRPSDPPAHAGHSGVMSRAAQPSTGSTTTRAPSSVVPTISWPGTNGKLTIGSK